MPDSPLLPEDLGNARELLLSHWGQTRPEDAVVEQVATAVSAERRSRAGGAISDGDLLAAHDELYASPVRHQIPGLLESLALALLARGIVPAPDDYGGKWWLWWPTSGPGLCQHCGNERALRRYSNMFGKQYRYLCQRCRHQELADDEAYLNRVTGVVPEPGASADQLFERRMTAILAQPMDVGKSSPSRPGEPGEDEWSGLVDDLEILLGSLAWAGWELPESYDCEFDRQCAAVLYGRLVRTGMVIEVEYEPGAGELRLQPFEDVSGDEPDLFSMLDGTVTIPVGHDVPRGADLVREQAGELGLLDATHLEAAPDSDITTAELLNDRRREWIFDPAAASRGLTLEELITRMEADEEFSVRFRMIVNFAGSDVLPDTVLDAAALGIAAWCWRNDTEVETWHLPSDALMAKVNIAVTKAVQPHVDPLEGVDWEGIEDALTDPAWALKDGRVISALFGEGWPEVQRTVREQVRMWRRFDEDLIGPEAMLKVLTIAGSTSYTRHWWGQGRWTAICRQIISDAIRGGIGLPPPYDAKGADALLRDIGEPDTVSDEVLEWMIDVPAATVDGPRGLRDHDACRPLTRKFSLYLVGEE